MGQQLIAKCKMDDLLDYIWRWKIVPTWMVHRRFYANGSPRAGYHMLDSARRQGFVRIEGIPSKKAYGWSLTSKGFLRVEPKLGNLVDRRFKTEAPMHDLRVAAFLGGIPMLLGRPNQWTAVTEQQIRGIDPTLRPKWFPNDLMRRPDGYWRICPEPSRPKLLAVEVEYSRKTPGEYDQILRDYDSCVGVDAVIWIVSSPTIRSLILRAAQSIRGLNPNLTWTILDSDLRRRGLTSATKNHLKLDTRFGALVHSDANIPSNNCWGIDLFMNSINFSQYGNLAASGESLSGMTISHIHGVDK
jgi:hypothetical protein